MSNGKSVWKYFLLFQCMYIYYLLGFGIQTKKENDEVVKQRKENTYILALDGDIDFQPNAVSKVLDLMKNKRNLGAVCGRIHPVGNGRLTCIWEYKKKLSNSKRSW